MTPAAIFRSVIRWLRVSENSSLLVAALAMLLSAYSVYFSGFLYRRQFELNVRPFVGISSVEAIKLENAPMKAGPVALRASVRNVGTLPASDVDFSWSWWISKSNGGDKKEAGAGRKRELSLFPNAQFTQLIPFEGRYDVYLSSGYEAHVQYDIIYRNAAANRVWSSHHEIVYSQLSGVSVVRSIAD